MTGLFDSPAYAAWTSWTPTLTLTSLSLTYAERTGEYRVEDDWCTATFTIRASITGTHGVPYDWVVNLPTASSITSGFRQNVGTMLSNLHVYPAGWGVASCENTSSSQNILFYLDSSTTVKMRTASHNSNVWSPSPDQFTGPEVMVSGTLQYKV
jgi:hypothetical protein